MNRRRFLEGCGFGLSALLAALGRSQGLAALSKPPLEVEADMVVVGGGLGGCAAALAALDQGLLVVLTEPTDWIGGQLTSQAVPPDEHAWIEQFGRNATLPGPPRREFGITIAGIILSRPRPRPTRFLNPGRGGVSRLCHEPRAALAVLTAMLAPHASGGRLLVLLEHEPVRAEVDGDRVRAVIVRDRKTRDERTLVAPYFLDATELGDLLPLAGVEFVVGRREPGGDRRAARPGAAATGRPAGDHLLLRHGLSGRPGSRHRPSRRVRLLARATSPASTRHGRASCWTCPTATRSRSSPPVAASTPGAKGRGSGSIGGSSTPGNFRPGAYSGSSGITLVNWPQNDYWLGPLVGLE